MKPNEPSRTALLIPRQRAAHQVIDDGSILYDPFAMKILHEDVKDATRILLRSATFHPRISAWFVVRFRSKK
jgi:O-methyltransferase involved in polyketide biosynthesis